MLEIKKIKCPDNKVSIKCPYSMKPTRIVIHNTANDASAVNEISYMHSNNNTVSFHLAVDDVSIIQGIELNRNSWNAGDGANGKGNREGIAIEICYSKSGGPKFKKAQENAAELTAFLLKQYGWGIDRVTKHQDYNGKYCPHRTLSDYGWDYFLNLVKKYMGENKKTVDELAKEVISGKWGNGADRKNRLTTAGYNYTAVQNKVDELMKKKPAPAPTPAPKPTPAPVKKSVDEVAKEVLDGKWGNGNDRKNALIKAGYNYDAVQKKVNELINKKSTPAPAPAKPQKKSVETIAREVLAGKWGNGTIRKIKLIAAGYNYKEVQNKVNELCK